MENQSTYRIRTKLGETEPINIPVNLMQEYNSFEILSLKINTDDTYRSYTSTEGIVIGRVSTANNGLGIPNVRVSIFVPKGMYEQNDLEEAMYPFSSPTDKDGDRVRYNLLPSDSDVSCYQIIGTLPTKRKILDNETVCEVFDKFYKYTTVTNEAGDFMLSNIPVGKQRIHIDADLSDIGPFLSQKPYDMIENLGFEKNRFESTRQFKTSKDLDSLAQVITQDKSLYVYPYWGDATEKSAEMKITRTDLSLNYEFKTNAIFMGSVITDKQSNSIRHNCTATENAGKMSEMVTGPGRIEMIRKTIDNKVEQYRVKGDLLINDNGVWCYPVPMNLDYVRTDEFGNIVPTDDPNKGVPTRARVRFRVTLNQMQSDNDTNKRCSYLVPNNPKIGDEIFMKENDADYSFGSETWDESFTDLFLNKVYTVKNYVPRIQKTVRPTNRKHTGVKMVNHFGDNNPFPYNNLSIKLNFLYRLICVIVHIFIYLIYFINMIISIIGALPCWLAGVKIVGWRPFKFALKLIPPCIELSSEFCDDGINKNVTYPGCSGCVWTDKTKPDCDKEQYKISEQGGEAAVCTNNDTELFNCVENQLAQDNEATSFNFSNDWINGCLYMPLWYRKIRPKKSFFFGLFKRRAKDQWCAGEKNLDGRQLKMASFCSHSNSKIVKGKKYTGEEVEYNITKYTDNCGKHCHEVINWVNLTNGVIINRENMLGQKVWYYKAVEVTTSMDSRLANEYENYYYNPMVSKTLYATDVVLLGSLDDCDVNGIPKFFNYLKSSTYNMPTDILFTDTEIQYNFDEKGNLVDQESHKTSVSSGCDWGNKNEYGYHDGGLFYSIGCNSIDVDVQSCINLRRICEIGVGLDDMKYVENIDVKDETNIGAVNIQSDSDELQYNELDFNLRPDGFISYDDIVDFDYRSMFATMNGNNLLSKINTDKGVKEYDFRYLYMNNFDGSLEEIMKNQFKDKGKANYRFNDRLEKTSLDYLTFRMGDRPYFYDGLSLVRRDKNEGPKTFTLPKYQNSFYFYFGLKEGKTAIDLFNEKYNEPCNSKTEEEESIKYEKQVNSWCVTDTDVNEKYNHKNYDGFIAFDLKDMPLPCTAILNSKTNSSVTYTVTTFDGKININHDKFYLYGNEFENDDDYEKLSNEGYVRYYLRYENASEGVDTSTLEINENDENSTVNNKEMGPCVMINNGEYFLYITDGEGNKHSFSIDFKAEFLKFDDVERKFAQPNNVLLKYYKTVGGKGSSIPYHNVSKTPDKDIITIESDDTGTPYVTRIDKEMTKVDKPSVLQGETKPYIKLNGTICLYNVKYNDDDLDKFIIEVEPYEVKIENGIKHYIDEDFWNGSDTETWYQVKMFNDLENGITCKDCSVSETNGKEYVNVLGNTPYFYYEQIKVNGMDVNCYVIKCPKGDVNYRVRVTQLCIDENGKYFKSQNYIERKINVSQPTPYKLFINDADYDIIKDFKTGWNINPNTEYQTRECHGKNGYEPFTGIGNINNIVGWLEFSNINKNYNWDEEPEKYGTNSMNFEKYPDEHPEYPGRYELEVAIEWKENREPKEPQRFDYDDESKFNEAYTYWLQDHEQWENGYIEESTGDRKNGYNDWTTIKKSEFISVKKPDGTTREIDIAGCCGYKYAKEVYKILENRLEFVKAMKSSFWIMCENEEKTVAYSVRTDDNPYELWSMYNDEYESTTNDDFHETESDVDSSGQNRHWWIYKGSNDRYIDGITIPNITSYNNEYFGIFDDSVRQVSYPTTYNVNICFGQDNIAEMSKDSGSISIKPPYMVACVNYEGVTKPNNLKKEDFYSQDAENKYGLTPYKFGSVGSNKKWLSDGKYEFFQYYLIDKIFAPDIVCWSYINNIPYYRPWDEWNCDPNDINRLGYVVKCEGIISGFIRNGITDARCKYVRDFELKTIFDKDTVIKTIDSGYGSKEDDIPTKRTILYGDNSGQTLTYRQYRHTNQTSDENQYRPVPNKQDVLDFMDLDGNCETTRELYGAMKIQLLESTLDDPFIKIRDKNNFSSEFNEKVDNSLTLKVTTRNCDTDRPITYYIFHASENYMTGNALSMGPDKEVWFPINAFGVHSNLESGKPNEYWLQCNENTDPWDGSSLLAPQVFNKNTPLYNMKDKYDKKPDLVYEIATSEIRYENEEGTLVSVKTQGYGNTGVFEDLESDKAYFVISVTENGCRTISPVYDFHKVYYAVGVLKLGSGDKVLRVAPVKVLYGNPGNYECLPRNYYLTWFDFTMEYEFGMGGNVVSNSNIEYKFGHNEFKGSAEECTMPGDAWVEGPFENNEGKIYYIVHTYTGGTLKPNVTSKTNDTEGDETGETSGTEEETHRILDYVDSKDSLPNIKSKPMGEGGVGTKRKIYYYKSLVKEIDENTNSKIAVIEYKFVIFFEDGSFEIIDSAKEGDLESKLTEFPDAELLDGEGPHNFYAKPPEKDVNVEKDKEVGFEGTSKGESTTDEEGNVVEGEESSVSGTIKVDQPKKKYVYTIWSFVIPEWSDAITFVDPRIPYFMRYTDKSLTDDEYSLLKSILDGGTATLFDRGKVFITDVTGLRHRCVAWKVINGEREWEKIIKHPLPCNTWIDEPPSEACQSSTDEECS